MTFRATLRQAWPVLVAYGVFSVWGVACFVASLALTSGGFGIASGDLPMVLGLIAATAVGQVVGNLLGLSGLRLVVVMLLFSIAFTLAALSGVAIGALALFLVVGVIAALGGYLGVASRLDVVAAWFPLTFAVGGAIVWMNRHGAISTFRSGAKHALWDPFTILCLSGAVFLMLIFLAARQSLGLTAWQQAGRPVVTASQEDTVAVARPGRGSLLVLLVFSTAVLGATALLSPYLFRTGPAKEGDGSGQQDGKDKDDKGKDKDDKGKDGDGKGNGGKGKDKGGADDGGDGHGNSGKGKDKGGSDGNGNGGKGKDKGGGDSGGDGDGNNGGDDPIGKPDPGAAGEAGSSALSMGLQVMAWFLALAVALLLLLLLVGPPIRRAFLLRHLEKPLWPVSPTSRVMNLWRRALAALAVIDVSPRPGETPGDFARRARAEVNGTLGCDAPGLVEAAAIVEKLDYAGRGLGPGEEGAMRDAVNALLVTIGPRTGVGKKLGAAWGPAPEVEP